MQKHSNILQLLSSWTMSRSTHSCQVVYHVVLQVKKMKTKVKSWNKCGISSLPS